MADTAGGLYAEAFRIDPEWPVNDRERFWFYHTIDLPRSGTQYGQWDLRGEFDRYVGGVRLAGRSVLDVGTAGGFLTFEAEKRGARVVSVDIPEAAYINTLPFPGARSPEELSRRDSKFQALKNAYWKAHEELGSAARVHYCDAYAIPEELGSFDVVMIGQIAVHLRDVIQLLASACPRSRDYVIIAEGMIDDDRPFSNFLGDHRRPQNLSIFWHHSVGLYRELLRIMGFELESKSTREYKCDAPGHASRIPITTLVFRRSVPG